MSAPVACSRPGQVRKRATARAARAAAFIAAGMALAVLLAPGVARAIPEDDVVPEGVLGIRLNLRQETQSRTIDRGSRHADLINYVIPNDTIRAEVDGTIERSIRTYDLLLTYGISDSWNLSLNLPYMELKQDSTLFTTSSDPEVQGALEGLETRRQSGLGDITVTSLHRPKFGDWNAVEWGWGVIRPTGEQEAPYVGAPTFDRRSAANSVFGFFHYTRFPAISRSRFDLRFWGAVARRDTVTVPGGERKTVDVGNRTSLRMGWAQELGPAAMGLEVDILDKRSNSVANERLQDPARAHVLRYYLGFGNMTRLESQPLAFPYQLNIQFEQVLRGTNVPDGDTVTVSLQTYF